MLPLVRMMGGLAVPTQNNICYYGGETIFYRTSLSGDWAKWDGTIVTVGDAGSPAGGAPYDYSSLETAIDSTSGDVAFMCHTLSATDTWVNGVYTNGRQFLIKGCSCLGTELPFAMRTPNPPGGFQFNSAGGETHIFENLNMRAQENWYAMFEMGRNSTEKIYVNKCRVWGTGDTYMFDFYKNGQPFKGTFKITYSRVERGYTTTIDHGDGSGASRAQYEKLWAYNNGEGNIHCHSCANLPDPYDYMQSASDPVASGYGHNVGNGDLDYYLIGFGPTP